MTSDNLDNAFKRVWNVAYALDLPELVQSTTHGTPSLKVKTSFIGRLKDADTFAIYCPLEEKPLLMENVPDIYFETDHYKGWPYILVHLGAISDAELGHRIRLAWLAKAPAKLRKAVAKPDDLEC
ncbi:MAG: MmcQ/YjbR family DNA-binding protein [Phyllobacterium sp.]|uniref:MmcQ/YjbR family DNA-binding protein n=1 Tax=Phyllobacterium sp. TaxID=1871046 RepID=UPI0030F0D27C